MTQPRALLPRYRYTFRCGDLSADLTCRKVSAMQAIRIQTQGAEASASSDDAAAVEVLTGLARWAVVEVHSLTLSTPDGVESLDSPTVDDLIESLDLGAVKTLFGDLLRGPHADFARPASESGHA